MAKQQLTPKSQDMSKWYTQVIQQAKLADYSPVKGCMVIRPNGYGIWENIQKKLDTMLKDLGVENSYFPVFIPLSFLQREAEHVKGFAPELAVVTHAGGEELKDKLVVRPTSETIMYEMYSQWIESYRDLPLNLNQWNSVVRWEKRTYLFLRTSEFLWQEAHTAHATHEEAWEMVLDGLEAYRKVSEEILAVPVIMGRKSESEKFAGAAATTTIEAMMPDGKALQAGTSHDLGQNFSQESAFNVSFLNKEGKKDYVWQTSYGFTTRSIGSVIMTHGDDDGLVLPPNAAHVQVSIVPVDGTPELLKMAESVYETLKKAGIRAKLFDQVEHRLGWRLNESEIQGIPVAIVIGKQEIEKNTLTAKVRFDKSSENLTVENVAGELQKLLETIQQKMYQKAVENRDSLMSEVSSYDEFKKIMEEKRGFLKAFWCEDASCEAQIKEETKATTRCLPFIDKKGNVKEEQGVCVKCGKPATHRWLFAQAY
jgi:prolyl-tRNA synthetase